jgi:putative effector of murein hydrolase
MGDSGSFVAGSITSGLKFDVSEYVGGKMKVNSIAQLFPAVVTNFMASPLLGVVGILKP